MTNRDFALNVMDPGEANGFIRMWETWLKRVEKPHEPIWIKEQRYNEFMDMEFDVKAWEDACTPKSPGSVPKDFMQSVKWAFRFSGSAERYAKRKAKKEEERLAKLMAERENRYSDPGLEVPVVPLVLKERNARVNELKDKTFIARKVW